MSSNLVCPDCGMYLKRYQALQEAAEGEPCPVCAGRQRIVRSRCNRTARKCHFLLVRAMCNDARPA